MATAGMMARNNFASQGELLQWLNSTLSLKLEKIEDTCSGAVACQLFDALYGPGTVNMKRVDFNVKSEYEFIQNYKELQKAFTKHSVDRAFNVSQLSKGKRQDNMEFMQFLFGYWQEAVVSGGLVEGYDAVGRRERMCKTGDWKKFSTGVSCGAVVGGRAAVTPATNAKKSSVTVARKHAGNLDTHSDAGIKAHHGSGADTELLEKERQEKMALLSEVTELKLKIDTAERERDFYFDKLRQIEIMAQAPELSENAVLRVVEKVLYAADADEARQVMLAAESELGAALVPREEASPDNLNVDNDVQAVETFLSEP